MKKFILFTIFTAFVYVSINTNIFASDTQSYVKPKTFSMKLARRCEKGTLPASPVISNGIIYVSDCNGMISAISQESGYIMWRYETDDEHYASTPVTDNEAVYTHTSKGLYRLNKVDGHFQWTTGADSFYRFASRPLMEEGRIYAGRERMVFAVDRYSGKTLEWRFYEGGFVFTAPVIHHNNLYVGSTYAPNWSTSTETALYSINKNTGELQWAFERHDKEEGFTEPCYTENKVYTIGYLSLFPDVQDHPSTIYALDENKGAQQWKYTLPRLANTVPYCYRDTVFIGGQYNQSLYAFTAKNGQLKWEYPVGDKVTSPYAHENTVYFGGGRYLYALNTDSGQLKWKFKMDPKYTTLYSIPLVDKGIVYFITQDGTLYAIDAETGTY